MLKKKKETELAGYLLIPSSPHKIKAPGPGDFTVEFYQTFKIPNSLYDTSISLILKPNRNNTKKIQVNLIYEYTTQYYHRLISFVNKDAKLEKIFLKSLNTLLVIIVLIMTEQGLSQEFKND